MSIDWTLQYETFPILKVFEGSLWPRPRFHELIYSFVSCTSYDFFLPKESGPKTPYLHHRATKLSGAKLFSPDFFMNFPSVSFENKTPRFAERLGARRWKGVAKIGGIKGAPFVVSNCFCWWKPFIATSTNLLNDFILVFKMPDKYLHRTPQVKDSWLISEIVLDTDWWIIQVCLIDFDW